MSRIIPTLVKRGHLLAKTAAQHQVLDALPLRDFAEAAVSAGHQPLRGAFLPGNQLSLEAEWKRQLKRRYNIEFTHLYTITNMPINRYLDFLLTSGNLEAYMEKLVNAFNPATVAGLMCRTTLSVGWDGRLFDCDFNQMLDLGLGPHLPQTIQAANLADLTHRVIQVGQHCFGCTAGLGSSCGGTTA